MRIKKTLSIQDDVLKKAEARSKEMFSGNFSMYITFLINQDSRGMKILQEPEEAKDKIIENGFDKESENSLDNIMGM